MTKQEIRERIRARKALLDNAERERAVMDVFDTLSNLAAFMMADKVLLYNSLPDELATREFFHRLPADKSYFLPRVNGPGLDILPYRSTRMHLGAFRIEEPDGDDTVDIDAIDLVVVPAVAYDRRGNRVGRGKGYYDRLLDGCRATTVGVCYDFQLVDEIEADEHDVPVDYVIAGGRLYDTRRHRR